MLHRSIKVGRLHLCALKKGKERKNKLKKPNKCTTVSITGHIFLCIVVKALQHVHLSLNIHLIKKNSSLILESHWKPVSSLQRLCLNQPWNHICGMWLVAWIRDSLEAEAGSINRPSTCSNLIALILFLCCGQLVERVKGFLIDHTDEIMQNNTHLYRWLKSTFLWQPLCWLVKTSITLRKNSLTVK